MADRVTQTSAEVVVISDSKARVTQTALEYVVSAPTYLGNKVTQCSLEYVVTVAATATRKKPQVIITV